MERRVSLPNYEHVILTLWAQDQCAPGEQVDTIKKLAKALRPVLKDEAKKTARET